MHSRKAAVLSHPLHHQRATKLPHRGGVDGAVAGCTRASGDAYGGAHLCLRIFGSHFMGAGLTGGEETFHSSAEGGACDPDGHFRAHHHGGSAWDSAAYCARHMVRHGSELSCLSGAGNTFLASTARGSFRRPSGRLPGNLRHHTCRGSVPFLPALYPFFHRDHHFADARPQESGPVARPGQSVIADDWSAD